MRRWLWLVLGLTALGVLTFGLTTRYISTPDPLIDNEGEVIAAIRSGLRNHSRRITVQFTSRHALGDSLETLAADWMEAAFAETDDPAEGDYLRYQYGGYHLSYSASPRDGKYAVTMEITPDYYLYLEQEEAVTARLLELFTAFDFSPETPEWEKLWTIYDYLCQNVRYDLVHRKNPHYGLRSTAYAALVQGTATCQGYGVALYRMLRMAGIPARIVTGMASIGNGTEYHAWVIAALDGRYYHLDPTWDAGETEYRYFLRGSRDFSDHHLGEAFRTDAFRTAYPLSETDYALFPTETAFAHLT